MPILLRRFARPLLFKQRPWLPSSLRALATGPPKIRLKQGARPALAAQQRASPTENDFDKAFAELKAELNKLNRKLDLAFQRGSVHPVLLGQNKLFRITANGSVEFYPMTA